MINYRYDFEDGYFCFTAGKMDRVSLSWEINKHGKVVSMKEV